MHKLIIYQKGLSEAAHAKRLICAQNYSRGGVGDMQSNLVIEANRYYLHTLPHWQLLGITGGVKFNYNHTPNYLELLREQKFNYKCILKCVKLRWVFFIVYQKGDLVKQPMQKGSFVPKIIPRVGGMVVDIIVQNTTRNIPVWHFIGYILPIMIVQWTF